MSELLTREQVEQLKPLALCDVQYINLPSGSVGVYSALAMMIDHDAALRIKLAEAAEALRGVERQRDIERDEILVLRAKLAEVEQRLEQQRTATYRAVEREHGVKQQLADRDQRIMELEHECQRLQAIP